MKKGKRYICFTCYNFHPEMVGVSEEEFQAGDNVCTQRKCVRKGEPLEAANCCEECNKLFPVKEKHQHNKQP